MAANTLNSKKMIEVIVFVVRAFVLLHQTVAGHKELSHKIAKLNEACMIMTIKLLSCLKCSEIEYESNSSWESYSNGDEQKSS